MRDEGNDIAKHIDQIEELTRQLVECVDPADLKRVLNRICEIYSCLGQQTWNELSGLNQKGEMMQTVCQKLIHVREIDPLLKLPELLVDLECDAVAQYKKALLELVPKLPNSIECTSSSESPVMPYFSDGVLRFFSTVRLSPAGSPTSSIHSLQLAPMDVEQ